MDQGSTVRNFRTVQKEGTRQVERKRIHYNLDVIISVGYRVNSIRGTQFRQWATQRINDFITRGVAVNEERLMSSPTKAGGSKGRFSVRFATCLNNHH